MKNNLAHLGKIKGIDKGLPDNVVLDRITELTFVLDNGDAIHMDGHLIGSVTYTYDEKLIIKTCAFQPNLYNMCIENLIFSKIKVYGEYIDLKNREEIHTYEREYLNFRFVNYSHVSADNNCEIYVLEGVNDE